MLHLATPLSTVLSRGSVAAAALALSAVSSAQASFAEGFDGKSTAQLQAEGWEFRNQSQPVGPLGWRPDDRIQAHAGTHYLVTDGYCMGGGGTGVVGSNWALFPAVANQVAGDDLVLHLAEGWAATRGDVLEVRYSPSGGTNTGSSATSVGDFEVLLATFRHDTIGWWQPHTITLPGAGRIALRFHVPNGRAASMYVDTVSVGEIPGGPLPLPAPGETVHWDSSLSPVTLPAGRTNIVAGGTVIVDPGVVVRMETSADLEVEGALEFREGTFLDAADGALLGVRNRGAARFLGTPSARVRVRMDQSYSAGGMQASGGASLTFDQVDASVFVWVASAAVATVRDTAWTLDSSRPGDSPGLRLYNGTVAVRDSVFTDGGILEEAGYLLLDRSTLTRSRVRLYRTASPQTLYLNNLVATGLSTGAPFEVHAFDLFLGPNNVIQGNLTPVRLESGGLAPGSTVPATGNINDWVAGVARIGSRATWAEVGVPYVLDWDNNLPSGSGRLTIEPGVTARFRRGQNTTSDAFPIEFYASLISRGTPAEPILLTDDGAGWGGLFFGSNSAKRPRLEHTIVENADTGAIAKACTVRLSDCLFRNNGTGAQSNSAGMVESRGTSFTGNGVGVETSPGAGGSSISAGRADLRGRTGPNTFAGNGQGVAVLNGNVTVNARQNWWGDGSGPQHPANPGGQGDSASPNALVEPFLTTAPPADFAPRVRLQRVSDILEEGTKLILRWDVVEDGTVVAQRLEFTPHGSNPPLSTLVPVIDPAARTLEIEVPPSMPSSNLLLPVLRLVATDDAGQEGWDEVRFFTPTEDFSAPFSVNPLPPVLRPGEQHGICWTINTGTAYLLLEDVDWAIDLGGTTTNCLSGSMTVPGVSTDLARVAVVYTAGAGGRIRYEYSDYFAIRPDPAIGDAPPTVQLLGPPSLTYAGGTVVPLTWTAGDDEALRSFSIQASYDGGRGWNSLVEGLPPTATSWNWRLPESTGIPDVRLRVVATDLRFQTTSASAGIEIVPSRPEGRIRDLAPVRRP